tara:strand:+ start:505 stop:732 length:228 start_codon:yes stop_codon:yes gene_type:complete
MRFASVKHAEYEILKTIFKNEEYLREVQEKGVPEGDEYAEKRLQKAALNIAKTFKNKMESRRKYLPPTHSDYIGE